MPDEPTPLRARLLGVHARAHLANGGSDDERRAVRHPRRSAWPSKLDLPMLVADATTTLAGIDERSATPTSRDAGPGRTIVAQARARR